LPLSVAPSLTWLSALALLPPIGVFLGVLQLSYADRRRLSLILLITGMISVALGLLQVAQGPSSPLRFYAFTNKSEAVGFFANRNHYSALLYCLVLIAAAWTVATVADFARTGLSLRSQRSSRHTIKLVVSFTVLVTLVAAQAMARSRAGLGLTIVALFGAFALAYWAPAGASAARSGATQRSATRLLLAAIALAVLFATQFALYRIRERFELDPLTDARLPFARNTIEAAIAYMPFGSGLGTFVPVYQSFEKASDNVASVYANHAHNEFLQLWFEAGLVGLVAMIGFIVWVLWTSWRVWRRGLDGATSRDNLLACAATLALILLLAHATVDYPLRTTALLGVAAWAIAMMSAPVGVHPSNPERTTRTRTTGSRATADSGPPRPFVPAPPRDDWPTAWRPKPQRS
jgi:O-antigen ligase